MSVRWQASVEVDADLHKVPDGPQEAAKYALDEIRGLEAPIVEVTRSEGDRTDRWLVDTADGTVEVVD